MKKNHKPVMWIFPPDNISYKSTCSYEPLPYPKGCKNNPKTPIYDIIKSQWQERSKYGQAHPHDKLSVKIRHKVINKIKSID